MKKLATTVLILIIALAMAACGNQNNGSISTEPTETLSDAINFDADSLVEAYHDGIWDGSFISNEEHCASIEEGYLWIDCKKYNIFPDKSSEAYWNTYLFKHDQEGSWIYEGDINQVSLWKKGHCSKEFKIIEGDPYHQRVYKLSEAVVSHSGENLWIYYDSDVKCYMQFDNIIDCYQNPEGNILFSTFKHQNFQINQDGRISKLKTSYVRFPRANNSIIESNNELILTQAFNKYYSTDWNGSTCIINDDEFLCVDDFGDIIVNNKVIGNVSLGTKYTAENGRNLELDDEISYWLNGKELVSFKQGEQSSIDIPDGPGEILWISKSGIVIMVYGDVYNTLLIVYPDDIVKIISTVCTDATVAYDTLYLMEITNTVYSLEWTIPGAKSEVYFQGAYAVSPHTDEAEGAIVPIASSNHKAYGYSNLYSPYYYGE